MDLTNLKVGDKGIIQKILVTGPLKRRFMDMGLLSGEPVSILKIAPLGDPITIQIKSYQLSLRKDEAKQILITQQL